MDKSQISFGFVAEAVDGVGKSDAELYPEVVADAMLGDKLGYDAAWMIEHHFSDYYPTPSPLAFLAHVAAKCPNLGLGTMVLVAPWYHPLRLAGELSMLSNLTRAPLHIGIGRGTAKLEYDAFGVDMEEARERFAETLAILKLALSGERFTFDGRYFKIPREVQIRPTPRRENLNLYGAIGSPPSATIMAELGLSPLISSNFPIEIQRTILGNWRQATLSRGGRVDTVRPVAAHLFIADTDDAARALARENLSRFCAIQTRHYETDRDFWKNTKGYEQFSRYFATLRRYSDPAQIDPWLDLQFVGAPKTVARKLEQYIDIGCNYFIMHTATYGMPRALRHEMLKRFAGSVGPDFSRQFSRSAVA